MQYTNDLPSPPRIACISRNLPISRYPASGNASNDPSDSLREIIVHFTMMQICSARAIVRNSG